MTVRHMNDINCFEHIGSAKIASWRRVFVGADSEPYVHPAYKAELPLYKLWHPDMTWDYSSFGKFPKDMRFRSIKGAQSFIDDIRSQEWYKSSFGQDFEGKGGKDPKLVERSRQRDEQHKITDDPQVRVLNWSNESPYDIGQFVAKAKIGVNWSESPRVRSRIIGLNEPLEYTNNKLVLLHELAHLEHYNEASPHGSGFRGAYVHLLHHALGSDASRAIRQGYRSEGLDWDFQSVHPDHRIADLAHETDK